MFITFPTRYCDQNGEADASIESNGRVLHLTVRGVRFSGDSFDYLQLIEDEANLSHVALATFSFKHNTLYSYALECEIPVFVTSECGTEAAVLQIRLGDPALECDVATGVKDLELELMYDGRSYKSAPQEGWFENALDDIQKLLPAETYIRCCFTCPLSDYSPYGNGMFGSLACFRDNKEGYLAVRGKGGLFDVWGTMTEFVQETYLCPQFQKRVPGTGYRG